MDGSNADWCTRCAAQTTWERNENLVRVKCTTCGNPNPWIQRSGQKEWWEDRADFDRTPWGTKSRPGR